MLRRESAVQRPRFNQTVGMGVSFWVCRGDVLEGRMGGWSSWWRY